MFNDRQLLGLSMVATAIQEVEDQPARDALACLFSGVLEFNNMFATYKGEGTGAVRHMFSHHILKPERTPIEANIWGTPKSSGSFSTLFRSRLLRAVEYKEKPFELAVKEVNKQIKGSKVYGLSDPIRAEILDRYPKKGLMEGQIYLSCASSSETDIPSNSIHLIITDPPFFDNVHYSELADFFYVWQYHFFPSARVASSVATTTRHPEEVQATNTDTFANNLQKVFKECRRVLKDDGLLVFTYHHSREEGWSAVAKAVIGAGFEFVQAQPVKSEMSVAVPKSQSKEPIDLDMILICRKRDNVSQLRLNIQDDLDLSIKECIRKVQCFNSVGRALSQGDIRVILFAEILVRLSRGRKPDDIEKLLTNFSGEVNETVKKIFLNQLLEKEIDNKSEENLRIENGRGVEIFLELG